MKLFKNSGAFDAALLIVYIVGIIIIAVRCQSLYSPKEVAEIRNEYEWEIEVERADAYERGYDDGYIGGYEDGYNNGYDDGYSDGFN